MSVMSADVMSESPGGTSPGSRVGRADLRALRRAREVPAGFLLGKKAGKSRNLAFFTERVPVGLRPMRTEAHIMAYNGIYRAISLYAVAGSPRGTRGGFRCMRERNPGAIFSLRLSRAIPTGDSSERRMPSVNRVSDIES